ALQTQDWTKRPLQALSPANTASTHLPFSRVLRSKEPKAHRLVNRRKPRFDMVNGRFPRGFRARSQRSVNAAPVRTSPVTRGASGVQRKVFRVEQLAGAGRIASAADEEHDHSLTDTASDSKLEAEWMAHELSALNSAITRNMRELSALINEGNDQRMARAAGELDAAVEGMEAATQKILASAEVIDDCARALAAALSGDYHHGLTQDVQDQVVRIYEACNFQDLAGQRIGKVIALLIMIEEKLAAMIACNSGTGARPPEAAPRTELINGPRLNGAAGHASQGDVDAMFA